MEDLEPKSFTGLTIPEQPIAASDFVFGSENNRLGDLALREILADGNWQPYMCPGQQQNKPNGYDTSDCTGFGYCHLVATQLNAMRAKGRLSAQFIQWAEKNGYIKNDSFGFDPQVLGIMAGTGANGNWLKIVADTARKNGLLPAGTLPGPTAYKNIQEFYNKDLLTEGIIALGKEFLQYIDLPYQWIGNLTEEQALKSCPLYVALCTCSPWNVTPVKWCGIVDTNHCVCSLDHNVVLDSYPPHKKTLSVDYQIPFKMMVMAIERKGSSDMTLGYQLAGKPTVYVNIGTNNLIAVADWEAFLAVGGSSNSVITLSAEQMAKFNIVPHTLFKSE